MLWNSVDIFIDKLMYWPDLEKQETCANICNQKKGVSYKRELQNWLRFFNLLRFFYRWNSIGAFINSSWWQYLCRKRKRNMQVCVEWHLNSKCCKRAHLLVAPLILEYSTSLYHRFRGKWTWTQGSSSSMEDMSHLHRMLASNVSIKIYGRGFENIQEKEWEGGKETTPVGPRCCCRIKVQCHHYSCPMHFLLYR